MGVGINLFNGSWSDKGDSVAHAYIHHNSATEKQIHAANDTNGHVMTLPAGAIKVFDATKIQRYFDSDGVGRFIFEGISASDATCSTNAENCYLSVMIYDNQQSEPLLERKVYLDLHDMKDFYQHVTAGPSAQQAGGSFNAIYNNEPITEIHGITTDIYQGLMPPAKIKENYTFFVHGWRMLDSEKLSFAETSFKRLYWSGYQGRFGALNWPTGWFDKPAHLYDPGSILWRVTPNSLNYNRSEAVARRVGPQLTNWLETLQSGNSGTAIHIIAHSMGNVVVSEALRAYTGSGELIASYTPSEAATVAGAYDQSTGLLINHKIKIGFGDCAIGTELSAEASWRCYNTDYAGNYDMPPDLFRSDYTVDNSGQLEIQHGRTTDAAMFTATGDMYYKNATNATGRIVNFWNADDAALNAWEFNQLTKPDNLGFGDWEYHNPKRDYLACITTGSLSCLAPPAGETVTSRFTYEFLSVTELQWSRTVTEDSANILSHIIPSRTYALGQRAISVPDNPDLAFTDSNQDHSGQFHGYYAEPSVRGRGPVRAAYWNGVLRRSLLLDSRTDLSGLAN